jgi:hypothetical protein
MPDKIYTKDISEINHDSRETESFFKTENDKIARRIGNDKDAPLHTYRVKSDINLIDLFGLASSSGLLEGESYDLIEYGVFDGDCNILTYSLDEISQFQVVIKIFSLESFSIQKRPAEYFMLQESGDNILLESGDNLKTQGLVP